MGVTLHPHRWMPQEGRIYDVAIDGKPIGTVGRWTFERGWWWQHVVDTARRPRTGPATTRREAVRLLVTNAKETE